MLTAGGHGPSSVGPRNLGAVHVGCSAFTQGRSSKGEVFDRTGRPIREMEAPDYHLNAGEEWELRGINISRFCRVWIDVHCSYRWLIRISGSAILSAAAKPVETAYVGQIREMMCILLRLLDMAANDSRDW